MRTHQITSFLCSVAPSVWTIDVQIELSFLVGELLEAKLSNKMPRTPTVRTAHLENLDDERERSWDDELTCLLDGNYPEWRNPSGTYMVPGEFSCRKRQSDPGEQTEKYIFDVLQNFGESRSEPMFVIHSYKFVQMISEWNGESNRMEKEWVDGDHDFVIIHLVHGIIFFQVKAGEKRKKRFRYAEDQLEKDKKVLKAFINENLPGNLREEMNAVLYKYPGFVVMPNCPGGKPKQPNGVFQEDCKDVDAFIKWWNLNVAAVKKGPPFSQELFKYLVMRFVGMSHSIPDLIRESIDETKKELEMCTKEQLSVILSSVPEQWIIGPAGSGKTWLLMKKVLMLAKNALSKGKKEKILVACHNEPLAEMFGKVFKDELILSFPESGDLEEVVEVKTFDSLLYDITGDFCQNMGKHVAQALELLEKGTMLTQRYDHIFVDDSEDLGKDKWPTLFKRMHKNNDADEDDDCCEPKHIWFFFDPNQDIDSSEEESQLPRESRKKTFRLSKVLRNTQMVFEQTKKYFKSNAKPIELGHDVCGLEIKWDDSLREEFPIGTHGIGLIKKHIEDLRGQKVSDKDICILTQTESIRDKVSSELKKVGIENQTANQMFQNDDNKVVVESIWRFKGLESKVVVLYCLPFIEQRWFPTLWSLRALLYTAFSRCLCYMIVISNAVSCKTLKSEKGYHQLPDDVLERREILNDFPKTYRELSSSDCLQPPFSSSSLTVIVGNWTLEPVHFVSQFVSLVFIYEDEERVVEAT